MESRRADDPWMILASLRERPSAMSRPKSESQIIHPIWAYCQSAKYIVPDEAIHTLIQLHVFFSGDQHVECICR